MEELVCFMNMAYCGTSNIRFKEKMFYEKLSEALTVSEEAFAILVFENSFKRWMYTLRLEEKKVNERSGNYMNDKDENDEDRNDVEQNNEEQNDDEQNDEVRNDEDESDDDINNQESNVTNTREKVPGVLYQTNIYHKKSKEHSAGRWTDEGYTRYNELLNKVTESRNSDWRKEFENELQRIYIENADVKIKAYKKRMKVKEEMNKPKKPKVVPRNMLDVMTL